MSRIWNLRLNLDEFNALVGMAFSETDKANTLNGLMAGLNGASLPEGCSSGVRAAFEVASRWRQEAEGFVNSQSIAGKASAEARKKKFGSAQPPKVVRTGFEQASNLTTIHNPQSINDNPPTEKEPSPQKRARLTRKQKVDNLSYPKEAVGVIRELDAIWPTVVGDRQILWDANLAASRVTDILNSNPQITPETLICAGKNYLQNLAKEPDGLKYVSALHFFFGPGKGGESAKWLREVRAINHAKTLEGQD